MIIQSKTSLSPCRLRDQRAMLREVSAGGCPAAAGWRARGNMTRHFFQMGAGSGIPPASPQAQRCQGAGLSHRASGQQSKARAAGCWRCKGQIANESLSVNTDALWRGLWQKCSSCYREPFTVSSERSVRDGALQADSCTGRGWQGSCL